MLIDTHCHMNMMFKKENTPLVPAHFDQAAEIIQQAKEFDVLKIINVGDTLKASLECIELARNFEELYAAIGIHPTSCTQDWPNEFIEFEKILEEKKENKIIAIGECGFDKHYPHYNLSLQNEVFIAHIELALRHNLPIIIHSRDAGAETMNTLKRFKGKGLRGVLHCFSEDLDYAKSIIKDFDLFIGIDGPLTYPNNERLRTVAKHIPLEHILLETDAPFLPPQIIRGKQNHPKYIKIIAQYLAELLDKSEETIAEQTTQNASFLFTI